MDQDFQTLQDLDGLAGEPDAVKAACPVRRGRPQWGQLLVTTPLAELDFTDATSNRYLCAWGIWVAGVSLMVETTGRTTGEDIQQITKPPLPSRGRPAGDGS